MSFLPASDASEGRRDRRQSAAFDAVLSRVMRFARDDTAPILLQGESGTGKTRLARQIHDHSPRAKGPFRHLVLSAVDDGVSASELFGHVPGAFTDARQSRVGQFASANGGTLFLDEIGKASLTVQAKLLHALEYGEFRPVGSDRDVRVNVRIVAATNVDLAHMVVAEKFLADLYARLETFRIVLPPLRKRRADIPMLVAESVARHAPAAGYDAMVPEIEPRLMAALQRAEWPSNIRQLDATVHRLLLEADGAPLISMVHCADDLGFLIPPHEDREAITAEQIEHAIHRAGSLSAAARMLGVDRKTLRLRRQRAGGASRAEWTESAGIPHALVDEEQP